MLVHELNCVFIHVPKCAGQSIETALMTHLGYEWEQRGRFMMGPNRDPAKGPARLAHMTAAEYVKFAYMTQQQFDTYFKFSIVRNPWARIVSEYHWAGHHKRFGFEDFLTKYFPVSDNHATASDALRHVIPQADFLYDNENRCLVDYLGRFETLRDDFIKICDKIGIPELELPVLNKKSYKPYQEYYTEKSKEIVAEKYARDIKLFGYSFDK